MRRKLQYMLLSLGLLILFGHAAYSQIGSYYSFSESTGTYTELTSPTVSTATGDDGEETSVAIGFTFEYVGTDYTTLTIGVNGAISFTQTQIDYVNNLASTSADNLDYVAPLWDDHYLRTEDAGEISYKLEGTSPNQTFTIQYKNISWRLAGSTVNFQIVLFEDSNNIEFRYGVNNSTESMSASIGLNEDPGGSGNFISVTPGSPATTSTTAANNSISTADYPGSGHIYTFTYSPPSCESSSNLSATPSLTSADLSWTAGDGSTWDIEWGLDGFTQGSGTMVTGTTDNPYSLSGLTVDTDYDWYVRDNCGGGDFSGWVKGDFSTLDGIATNPTPSDGASGILISATSLDWDDVVGADSYTITIGTTSGGSDIADGVACATSDYTHGSNWSYSTTYYWTVTTVYTPTRATVTGDEWDFTSECDSYAVPWNEGFEGMVSVGSGIVPVCMAEDGDWATGDAPQSNGRDPRNGSNYAYTSWSADDWLFTPGFDLTGGTSYDFSFWYVTDGNTGWTTLEAMYGTGQTSGDMTAAIGTAVSGPTNTSYVEYRGSFTPATTGTYYMGIHVVATSSPWYMTFDDLLVEESPTAPPSCTTPISPTDTETGVATSGNLEWNSASGATGYKIWCGTDGGGTTDPTTVENGTDLGNVLSYGYSGFDPNTVHYWKIVPYSGNGDATGCSIWSFETGDLTCTETASASGQDDDPTIVTISSFSCTGGGTITGMTLDGSIGSNCPSWYSYDIYVNGSPIETQQCNQTGYDLTSYLPITSVSLQSNDEDAYSDGVTLELTLHIAYIPAACPPPTNLTVTNLTTSSADLGWTEGGTETAWNIEWGETGFTQGSGTLVSLVGNPYNLTGLTVTTTYDWYVQSDCDGTTRDESTWVGPNTFTTSANAVTSFPWAEGFENGGSIPLGWSYEYASGTHDWVYQDGSDGGDPTAAHSGSYNAAFIHESDGDITKLLTLPLDLSGLTSPYLTFWHAQNEWFSDQDELRVYYSNDGGATWIMIPGAEWTGDIPDWTKETFALPSPSGDYYIAFEGTDGFGYGVVVDDVRVLEGGPATATWSGGTSGDWHTAANWSGSEVPGPVTDVTIPTTGVTSFLEITAEADCNNFTVQSDASGNGQVLGDEFLTVNGTSTVQRHITGGVWHDLSASTQGQTVNSLYMGGSPDVWLRRYNEPTNDRTYITELTDPLPPGAGFEVWVEAGPRFDITVNYTGALQTTDVTLNTSSTPALSYSNPEPFGYNLIGNPFASPIDLDEGTWSLTDVSTSFWVWSGTWLAWNTSGGGSGTLGNGIVPMGQGFFIQATGAAPSITIPMDARVHSGQPYYKNTEEEGTLPQLLLNVSIAESYDKLNITFHKEASEVFDMFDTRKLFAYAGDPPQIYSEQSGEQLTINGLPFSLLEKGTSVKVGFIVGENGDHTIETDLSKLDDTEVWLEDLSTGHLQSLNDEPKYEFKANTEDEPERFILHFNSAITGIEDPEGKDLINVYAFDDKLCIKSTGDAAKEDKEVWIYDMFGRTAIQTEIAASSFTTIPVHQLKGYVVVKIISESGVKTNKVYIK